MKKRNAFTLAEVVITLGRIGIVAAMTLPAILAKTEKQETVAKLKKVYSVLSQGIKRSELDNGEISEWPTGADITDVNAYFDKYWRPYYKNPKICSTAVACGYSNNFAWTNLDGERFSWSVNTSETRVAFLLSDQTFIFNPRNSTFGYVNYFYVDLNGPKNPNVVGKDVFIFTLSDKKLLRPFGYDKKYEDLDCSKQSSGNENDCTAKIMADGWEKKDDYPW